MRGFQDLSPMLPLHAPLLDTVQSEASAALKAWAFPHILCLAGATH